MSRIWFKSMLSIVLFTASLYGQSRESLLQSAGKDSGWTPAGQPVLYDSSNIAKLGRQSAAVIHYGFTGVTAEEWKGPDGRIHLTLYQMTDPSAAYGLFTFERGDGRDDASVPMGAEGFRRGAETCFWQSKYVVRIDGDTKASDTFGRLMTKNIFGSSQKPPVSDLLPSNGLVRGTEHYVLGEAEVDPSLGLNASALGFSDDAEMATASYRIDGKSTNLVLLLYPTQQVAKKYAEALDAKSPNDANMRKRVGALLAIIRGTNEPAVAKQVLDLVNYETQVTWDEARPGITMGQIIITAFTFIAIALLFTIVAGMSFGGFRIFMKSRYPNRGLGGTEDLGIIQLKLAQEVTHKELGE